MRQRFNSPSNSRSRPPRQRSTRAWNAAEWLWCTVWHSSWMMTNSCRWRGNAARKSDSDMSLRAEQLPHLVRAARTVTRPTSKPKRSASAYASGGRVRAASAQPLDLLPRDMRYRLASFGHAALSRYDPFGLCVEKGQGASAADQCGVAEPYSARGLDRKAYAARAHRNNALHFAQKRMPDRCHCRPRIYPMR